MSEKRGIDNVKKAVLMAVKLSESIDNKLEDGKITLLEAAGVAIENAGDIVSTVKNLPVTIEEIDDLDQEEMQELHEAIKKELDLNNDDVEDLVMASISLLEDLVSVIHCIKQLRN